jgi:hypothetical protein
MRREPVEAPRPRFRLGIQRGQVCACKFAGLRKEPRGAVAGNLMTLTACAWSFVSKRLEETA